MPPCPCSFTDDSCLGSDICSQLSRELAPCNLRVILLRSSAPTQLYFQGRRLLPMALAPCLPRQRTSYDHEACSWSWQKLSLRWGILFLSPSPLTPHFGLWSSFHDFFQTKWSSWSSMSATNCGLQLISLFSKLTLTWKLCRTAFALTGTGLRPTFSTQESQGPASHSRSANTNIGKSLRFRQSVP